MSDYTNLAGASPYDVDPSKSRAKQVVRKRREIMHEQRRPGAPLAPLLERQIGELVTLPNPPDVGPGGEVVDSALKPLEGTRWAIRDTLAAGATAIAEEASLHRDRGGGQPNKGGTTLAAKL